MVAGDGFPAERGMLLWGSGVLSAMAGDIGMGVTRIMEGQRLLEETGDLGSSTRALIFAGMFLSTSGDTERATGYLDRALAMARERDDSWAVGEALTALAHVAITEEDYERARRYAEEAITWFPPTRIAFSRAHLTNMLGDLSRLEGAYKEASEQYESALAATTESGFHAMVPSMRHNLAWASHDLGDDARAIELFTSALREFQQMGDERGIGECLVGLGCTSDRPEVAAQLFAAGFSILQKHEMPLSRPNQRDYDRSAALIREMLGEETWQEAWAQGARLTPDEALALTRVG
jgi:tetratricopeptide (TPR) repeat protein